MVGIALLGDEVVQDDVSRATRAVLSPALRGRPPRQCPVRALAPPPPRRRRGRTRRPGRGIQRAFAPWRPGRGGCGHLRGGLGPRREGAAGRPATGGRPRGLRRPGGLVSVLVVGQALSRHIALVAADFPTLRSVGLAPRQLLALGVFDGAVVAVGGHAVAALVAVALSPLGPVGPVRRAEPDPGDGHRSHRPPRRVRGPRRAPGLASRRDGLAGDAREGSRTALPRPNGLAERLTEPACRSP